MSVDGSNILVGVTGGIAAYKAAALVSLLQKNGANVRVVMTENGAQFVSPVTFQTLTDFPARTRMFEDWAQNYIPHIGNAQWADVMVVVPATANIIGKIAGGIADDLLTSTIIASQVPVVIAPAMNSAMYDNPIVQQNIAFLRNLGYYFVEPGWGRLACGTEGRGRLAPIEEIMAMLDRVLSTQDMAGLKFLITAGGTREPIDPVRYISNRSSGKMGYALASAVIKRGGSVNLVSAPTHLTPPSGAELVNVETALDMLEVCKELFYQADVLIMAAAVSDYMPETYHDRKLKKYQGVPEIALTTTPDIVKELSYMKREGQFIVGFAAETEDLEDNARKKMYAKNLDLIVANDITKGIFGSDSTSISVIDIQGIVSRYDKISKAEAAEIILDGILEKLPSRS